MTDAVKKSVLPPYMRHHWSASAGTTFLRFEASTKMRQGGFPISSLPLGTDLTSALTVYKERIAPLLEAWWDQETTIVMDNGYFYGSVSWAYGQYQKTNRFKLLGARTKQDTINAIQRCLRHVIQAGPLAGRRFGDLLLSEVTPSAADDFYDEYLETRTDEDGSTAPVFRPRTARNDMHILRTMINAIMRKHRNLVNERTNPFVGMHMPHKPKGPPPVTSSELVAFVNTADSMGWRSISAIVLYAWEFMARVTHFPFTASVDDYKGRHHRKEIFVRAEKVDDERFFALYSRGNPLYPALMERLDELKGDRVSGPLFVRESTTPGRVAKWPRNALNQQVAAICKAAGIPDRTLTQFRKGGMNEGAEAGWSPSQFMSHTMHKHGQTPLDYIQRSQALAKAAQLTRLKYRQEIVEEDEPSVT